MVNDAMTAFPIRTCPLCQQTLKLNYLIENSSDHGYICPKMEMLNYDEGGTVISQYPHSHYSVLYNGGYLVQHVIIPPYYLTTSSYTNNTMIYAFANSANKLIMELPAITIQNPDKLLNRIKLLIPFS